MCGLYVRKGGKQKIAEAFRATPAGELPMPDADYNVAPTTYQPIIRHNREGERELLLARWGLISYATESIKEIKGTMCMARSDTLTKVKAWREPIKKRRCLVPASSFYEWPEDKSSKQPYAFELTTGGMFAFAGIWDAWKDQGGSWIQSFAVITTAANELLATIHSRMPVILHPRDYDLWLDRDVTDPPFDLLRPYEPESMEMHEANPDVNSTRNNGPEMFRKPKPRDPFG